MIVKLCIYQEGERVTLVKILLMIMKGKENGMGSSFMFIFLRLTEFFGLEPLI